MAAHWLAVDRRRPELAVIVALVALVLALWSRPVGQTLADAVGRRVAGPVLPVVVVEVEGPLGPAAKVASRAGASSVRAALPRGHFLLDGVDPEPDGLAPDRDGVVRRFGGVRLPVPEALGGVARVSVEQLDPSNPSQLAGRDVVLSLAGVGDGAELVAVALGTGTAGLVEVPLAVVALAATGLAVVGWAVLSRVPVAVGVLGAVVLGAAAVPVAVGARALGVVLPLEALVPTLGVPVLARLLLATGTSLAALDRIALRLGAPSDEAVQRSGIEARGAMAAMLVTGHAVATWVVGADGRVVRAVLAGDAEWLPSMAELPGAGVAGKGWRVEPVLEDGVVVGAIGVAREAGGVAAEVAEVLRAIAGAPLSVPERRPPVRRDPFLARLGVLADSVDRALKRSDAWRALLGESGLQLGLFELGGDLVAAARALRDRIDPRAPNPLLDLLQQVTSFEPLLLRTVLRRAIAAPTARRLPSRKGDEELVLSRVESGGRVIGLLVQVHDVRLHHKLDELKSTLILAHSARLRNVLGSVAGYADMAMLSEEAAERDQLLERIRERVLASVEDIDRAEALAQTKVGQEPIQPVFLAAAVREATGELPASERSRLEVDLPEVETPVAARAVPLVRALHTVLAELLRQGSHVKVRVWPEVTDVRLLVEDDSGGLPAAVLDRWMDPEAGAPIGAAVGEIRAMGGTLAYASVAGVGTRVEVAFPIF